MNLHPAIPVLLLLVVVALAMAWRTLRIPVRHRWRRRQVRVMVDQLQGQDRGQPFQLIYARLRAMDPLAFEELLLECFARRGVPIVRNTRYTGDGGIDGRVVLGGETYLIQAKRYSSAIRPDHIASFATICRARRCRGLFIHTGRTGPRSRQQIAQDNVVTIVSGGDLIALIRGDRIACLEGPRSKDRTSSQLSEREARR